MYLYDIYYNKKILKICQFRYYLFTGTKECYSGPLHLVESIRIALGNMSNQEKLLSEHPEDKSQNDNLVHSIKDTLDANSKAENNFSGISQRKKMP